MYMDFSFFLIDNKSGYKTKESWFSKNYPEEYNNIISYCKDFNYKLSFKEKIFFFFHKLVERPKCVTCGNEVKFRERFDTPYGDFCSIDCINSNKLEMISRISRTIKKKYGVDFYPEHSEFVEKQKKTKKERYGDEKYNNIQQTKKTKLEKYGDINYNNVDGYQITCLEKYGSKNYSSSNSYKNKIVENFKKIYPELNFTEVTKYSVKLTCDQCNENFEITKQLLYERNKRNYNICINCNPVGQSQKSGYEIEISDFLKQNNIFHETNNRKYISKEIDILIPDRKLAIEINGLYWHNELFLPTNYHLDKTIECTNKNISLIHIFEDEWQHKKNIVKSILKNRLGISDKKIFGRNCSVKEISYDVSKKFLEHNHIQGNVKSKIRIGLFYENELVSVMTFSKGRIIMGGKENEWELTRFCNLLNTNIVGGASKLFKFFLKKYNPTKVISYSDIRLFDGKIYENLGFIKKSQSKPNYWYVINSQRHYRFNFTKFKLVQEGFDKNKTEKEIMFERKYYRIYDCGNIRWEYDLHLNQMN